MRSSTSSSDQAFERAVPRGRWGAATVVAVTIALVAVVGYEALARSEGYEPCLNDGSDLWAKWRREVIAHPERTVVIGSSRIQFDLDLEVWAEHFGTERPIQLAIPGTNPLAILEDLAAQESFTGTLVMGVTPGLWFAPGGPPVARALEVLGRAENWSPSQQVGLELGTFLQERLAFINGEDLALRALLLRLELEPRARALPNLPPAEPAYIAANDRWRRARLWEKCGFGTPLARKIQQIWIPLFTPPPPPPHLSPEELAKARAAGVEANLQRIAAATATLRARGVRMVFVRPPSTSTLRERERQNTPRAAFYDRMLAVSGVPGVHFEDHPELAGFDCPEWSHLTVEDATRYTKALMPLVERALGE